MKLVDVHCHLESEHFINGLDALMDESRRAGLVKLITASIEPEQWPLSLDISRRYDEVECALGLHPWYLRPEYRERIPELLHAKEWGAVAIGELGLDRKIDSPSLEMQIEFFEDQLRVAGEINLPLVLHCRGAFQEMLDSFRRVGVPEAGGIIHSFNGSAEVAESFLKYGISFSIGGILTYRDSARRAKLLRRIYPGHFLLETDAPDIPPVEARTDPPSPNRPCNIIYNLKAAAEILERSEEEVAENTTANAVRIFGLSL